jgi:6-phosphofructokinase 1
VDNDLAGSAITIGVDTALNIALEALDRLKVTASSHHRAFLVEVMGRNCGYLALMTKDCPPLLIYPGFDV